MSILDLPALTAELAPAELHVIERPALNLRAFYRYQVLDIQVPLCRSF